MVLAGLAVLATPTDAEADSTAQRMSETGRARARRA
jgi:hypothetical protein